MRAETPTDSTLLEPLRAVAPGTALRLGVDDIIRARLGALIVIGEPAKLEFLFSGGMRIDLPFSPQHLYELAKMDGAIVVDSSISRLVYANVQLLPDPKITSSETGTRHRTAERVARQTEAIVVSISQQRETVTLFYGEARYQLARISDLLGRTNQALATLETYRQRLDQGLTRLLALEFQSAVTLDDVIVVLQRAEMTSRMAEEVELNCVELGQEARLIRMQLDELAEGLQREREALIVDYIADSRRGRVEKAAALLAQLTARELVDPERYVELLGYPGGTDPLDRPVDSRGFRVLSRIPRVPESVVRQLVRDLGSLDAIVRASHRELERVEGVGAVRAKEIRDGLRRLQEHNLVERYLEL